MTAAGAFQNKAVPSSPQESRPREPSMEDILASIRRIIADDQLQSGRPGVGSLRRSAPPSLSGPAVAESPLGSHLQEQGGTERFEDVLDLAKMPGAVVAETYRPQYQPVPEAEPAAASSHQSYTLDPAVLTPIHGSADSYVNGYSTSPEPVYAPAPVAEPEPEQAVAYASDYAEEHVSRGPFQDIESAGENTDSLISADMGASVMSAFETLAATVVLQNTDMLDRVMHDLMRPMLKTWLDENLPTLVERLVRTEIERVARGNRR